MSNKLTAIQELISEMEELKKTKLYDISFKAIDDCIALAYNKLIMEKEKIKDAWHKGYDYGYGFIDAKYETSEQYYKETYEE